MAGIKGTRKELYVRKESVDILTFTGSVKTVMYSEMKRIDYCFSSGIRSGYIEFITANNQKQTFEFGKKVNEDIKKVINTIHKVYPDIPFREYEQDENKKDRSVSLMAIFGYKEIGLEKPEITIHQKTNNDIYFNGNTITFYRLLDYEWDGAEFSTITHSSGSVKGTSSTNSIEKSSGLGAGILLGGLALGAMGGKSKGLSKTVSDVVSNATEISGNIEKNTNATLTFRNNDNGKIYRISFNCNRNLDAKIRCFDFEQKKQEVIADTSLSLEGIKALKELLDMGAITQEEFDTKKKQILGL